MTSTIHNILHFSNTGFSQMNGFCQEVLENLNYSKKLNCSPVIPTNRSSSLIVNLPKDLNRWRLEDRISDERKYVIHNHDLNSLIKSPFGVVTAFPDDPNLDSNSPSSSSYLPSTSSNKKDLKCNPPNTSSSNRSNSVKTTSNGIQAETEKRDSQTDFQ